MSTTFSPIKRNVTTNSANINMMGSFSNNTNNSSMNLNNSNGSSFNNWKFTNHNPSNQLQQQSIQIHRQQQQMLHLNNVTGSSSNSNRINNNQQLISNQPQSLTAASESGV